jgi:hypothetical protein
MTCAKQTWLGAYVLDALEPGETEDVSTHIAGCSICQDEVVRLAWIPGLLRTIALEDIERLDDYSIPDGRPHSPALDQPQTASRGKRTTRRWRRPVAVLAGLAAAATIAGAVAIGLGEFPRISHRPVAIRTIDPRSHVQAAVTLNGRTWGTELRLTLRSVPPGEHCSLVARARDGRSDTAATWVATYQGSADVPGTTAIPIDQLSEVDIVTSDGQRLARLVVPNQAR